jgi:hypothetical protein
VNEFYVGQKVVWRRGDGENRELEVISVGDSSIGATDGTHAWQFGSYEFCVSPLFVLDPVPRPPTKLFSGMGLRDRIGVVAFMVLMGLALVMAIVNATTGWGYWIASGIFWITLLVLHPALCLGEWIIKKTRAYARRKRATT